MKTRLIGNWFVVSVTAFMLMISLIGLLGPKPGQPADQRSLDIGPLWLTRMTESSKVVDGVLQVNWKVEGNWSAIVWCAALLGVVTIGAARMLRRNEQRGATTASRAHSARS